MNIRERGRLGRSALESRLGKNYPSVGTHIDDDLSQSEYVRLRNLRPPVLTLYDPGDIKPRMMRFHQHVYIVLGPRSLDSGVSARIKVYRPKECGDLILISLPIIRHSRTCRVRH